jgi:hypothetical protein
MQATGQAEPHVDPNGDPHDTIIALLRGAEPARSAHDRSELNISPVDHAAVEASSAAPPINPASRATPLNDVVPLHDVTPLNDNRRIDQPRTSRPGRGRGIVRFLLTVCAGVVATIGWQAYGDDVLQRTANLMPQLLGSAPAQATSVADNPAPVQAAATEPAAAQGVPPAPAPSEQPATAATPPPAAESAPAQAAIPVEVTQSIEAMSRDIASLKQTIEQLKDGQEKLSQDLTKAVEQETRKKTAVRAPKPTTSSPTPPQRASAPPPPPQAAASPRYSAPYPPPQPYYAQGAAPRDVYSAPPRTLLPPEPGYATMPRPPRPLP